MNNINGVNIEIINNLNSVNVDIINSVKEGIINNM